MLFSTDTPESVGISSSRILSFIEDMEQKQVPMHSLLLYVKDKLVVEGYYAPYKRETLHRTFSISKSVTALAIGILISDGKLSLSDSLISYFPEKLPAHPHPWITEMTIRDLLMMRTCHAATTYKGADDWVGSFFQTTPTHKPGSIFHYDTSAAHVLAALVEKLSGMSLLSFLKQRIPELSLSADSYMLTDPNGVSMGGSGLVATPTDMLKIGYLLLHKGKTNGRQIITEAFLNEATSCLTETRVTGPIPSEACGYGYMIWINEKGGYVCYGMGGQFIMVFPDKEMIFVTTADTQGIAGGNQLIYDSFYKNIYDTMLPCDLAGEKANEDYLKLQKKLQELAIAPISPFSVNKKWADPEVCSAYVNNKSYRVHQLSLDTGDMKASVVSGFTRFSFHFGSDGENILSFVKDQQEYQLTFGFDKLSTGTFPIYNLFYAASGAWLDSHTLYIRFHIIDKYVGSVHMQFYFGENDLTIYMKKIEESCFLEFNGHLYAISE